MADDGDRLRPESADERDQHIEDAEDERAPLSLLRSAQDDVRDEETREHEEEVDADEAALESP